MTIRITKPFKGYYEDQIVSGLGTTEENRLVGIGFADFDLDGHGNSPDSFPAVRVQTVNGQTVLVGAGGNILRGPMVSGAWFTIPSIFRLRLTGTGTVTIDAKDSLGNITALDGYTVTGATDQIEFPYAGDDAVMIAATFPATVTVEVI